jgi:hypothetical protein
LVTDAIRFVWQNSKVKPDVLMEPPSGGDKTVVFLP